MTNPFTFMPGEEVYFSGAYDLERADRAEIIKILARSKVSGTFTYESEAKHDPADRDAEEDYWRIYYRDGDAEYSFYVEYDDEVSWYLEDHHTPELRDTLREVFEYLVEADHITLHGPAIGESYV